MGSGDRPLNSLFFMVDMNRRVINFGIDPLRLKIDKMFLTGSRYKNICFNSRYKDPKGFESPINKVQPV